MALCTPAATSWEDVLAACAGAATRRAEVLSAWATSLQGTAARRAAGRAAPALGGAQARMGVSTRIVLHGAQPQ